MKEDTIITLGNGKRYGILLESETMDDYFLAVLLDSEDKPTSTYTILKKVTKDGTEGVKIVDDVLILNSLLDDFHEQYRESLEEAE